MKETMISVLNKLNKVYKEVNPSTYFSIINKKNIKKLENQRKVLFHNKLNLPIELFKNKKLLDLGSGTGMYSIIYNLWGSDCTLVEYDKQSYKKSKEIFTKFQQKKSTNKFINKDIFKFRGKSLYDIVHCNGVLHHLVNKEQGIRLMSQNLKKGGIFILGTGTITGFFQRNLQRYLLYYISKDKEEIIKNAKKYFGEHLKRAAKGSGRSILAVIYDSYINNKIDTFNISDLFKLFKKNKIDFYSSFPQINNIVENEMEWKHLKGNNPSKDSINFTNYLWFLRSTEVKIKKNNRIFDKLLVLSKSLNNISFENKSKFITKMKKVKSKLRLNNKKMIINTFPIIDKTDIFFSEIDTLLNLLKKNKHMQLKKFLQNTKYLFKGYSGLGMNYFIGFKK